MKQGLKRILENAPPLLMAALLMTVTAACETNPVDKNRSEAFKQYKTIIRWSQWDAAADFIAPEYLEQNPITRLDMDRLRLFRVTSYTIRSTGIFDEGMTARQVVAIRKRGARLKNCTRSPLKSKTFLLAR